MLADAPSRPSPPPRTPPRRAALAHAAAAAVLLPAFAVLYAVCVLTAPGQRQEDAVHLAATRADGSAAPVVTALTGLVEALHPVHLAVGLGAVAGVGLLRRRGLRTVAALGTALGSLGLAELLKHVVLPRPALASGAGATVHNSLPSGHTTAVLGLVLALLLVLPPRLRAPLAAGGALAAAAMAGSVVDEGWHRVSDSLAAVLLTTAVFAVATGAVLAAEPGARGRRGGPWLLAATPPL
ncbi:phosphatase PAP2 family protein, partial [Kineococcus glutinatus]|uniref:phosphatase PAP2 family protein n=1 Tax=Kineococcus glutinatus TaxID=1070872 RepID=UPI0031E7606F